MAAENSTWTQRGNRKLDLGIFDDDATAPEDAKKAFLNIQRDIEQVFFVVVFFLNTF